MRTIGSLSDEREARLFEDYLLTLDVKAMVEPEDGEWTVWIYDEDHLDVARDEFAGFRENPTAEKYQVVRSEAERLRKEAEKQEALARKRTINVRDRWNRPLMQQAPLTMILIAVSILVTLASRQGKQVEPLVSKLAFAEFHSGPQAGGWYLPRNADGDEQIRSGEIWRTVTPIFIHLSIWHLFFNMYWTYHLGRMIESRRGTLRLAGMVLLVAVLSNYLQFTATGRASFGGMSGVVYGLFGYIWMKMRFDPGSGMFLPQTTVFLMIGWFVLCWTDVGIFKGVANWAHAGGLAVGMILGYAPIALRDLRGQ